MNIEEGNKLIAEFMGYSIIYGQEPFIPFYQPLGMSIEEYESEVRMAESKHAEWEYFNRLQYHSSWDWIMPVVEKIIKTSWNMEDAYKKCSQVDHALNYVDINTLWQSVVQFVEWYNKEIEWLDESTDINEQIDISQSVKELAAEYAGSFGDLKDPEEKSEIINAVLYGYSLHSSVPPADK